ncbi:MAG: glycosyltransferase [Bacilli bacterium]|nr:glycosyltransferase [Bacilli bacterium]
MDSIKYLIGKTKQTLKNEGIVSLTKKTTKYIFNGMKSDKQECKDVLFINGCTLPHPSRYRVAHQREQLESNGMTTDEIFYETLTLEKEKYYRCFVFFRCPITDTIKEFIKRAKYNNKIVFYDIDDLVFDKQYTKTIKYLDTLSKDELNLYYDGVERMGETLKLCDYAITTTETLAKELKKYVKDVYINRNVASERMCELSINAISNVNRDKNKIIMGYLSGSITHNPDFELILPAIIKIMKKYEYTYLKLVGILDIPEELSEFKDRIIVEPFKDWTDLPSVIATLDINLAPLEMSLFNEAKSENKWTEAALVKVPTIASNVGAFKVINNKVDGILVENNKNDWYNKLEELVQNEELREKLGQNAYNRVLKEYISTYSGYKFTKFIKSKLNKSIAFILPTTNVSGGVNVVIKHCNILRNHGYDVFIINMDKFENNIINIDGEINVISSLKTKIVCHLNKMVGTLWTTIYFAKDYHNVDKIAYLVQNFETNFLNYGNYNKQIANTTYSFDDVEYLTISKWCEKWLINDFERKVKYAPNGIKLEQFPTTTRNFDGKIRILVEGNSDDYYKNVDESFKIVEKLDKSIYEIKYLSYQGEPKKWYYVDEFLHKVPYDEVGKIYNSADILIKSSILESFSYPPLEMMATGGISVVAPNDGNIEYLKDNENCLLYEQGNIDDAVEKIEMIRNDKKLRNKLIKGGLETATSREWTKIEKEIVDLYE